MAEKLKDAEDRLLEGLFATDALADDGFSAAVVQRINRRIWMRRLLLPGFAALGAVISLQPLLGLAAALGQVAGNANSDALFGPLAGLPLSISTVATGAALLVAGMLTAQALTD